MWWPLHMLLHLARFTADALAFPPRRISENLIDSLDHEVIRLSSQDVPTAYAKTLEDATIVSSKDVVKAIHRICGAPARV